jgi:uncharacterized delta-60 repeat protein
MKTPVREEGSGDSFSLSESGSALELLLAWRRIAALLAMFGWLQVGFAQWVAVNDQGPGPSTHPNAMRYDAFGANDGTGGPLRDIQTGATLPVTLTITMRGFVNGQPSGSDPPLDSALYQTFHGLVDFANSPTNNVGLARGPVPPAGNVTYTISGLNPAREYILQGGAVYGDPGYTDRWTLFELAGADGLVSAHQGGLTTAQVGSIATNQVAINTGIQTGDMFEWRQVNPGADGTIQIICTVYKGTVPGGSSAGTGSYALTALRIQEPVGTAPMILTNPQSQVVRLGDSVTWTLAATGYPLFYQWFRNHEPILGATHDSLTLTNVSLADDGSTFSVVVSNELGSATSQPATLTVRGPIVALGHAWRYEASGLDLGAGWREPGFNDSPWPVGPGPLGFETAALPVPIQTLVPNHGDIAYYFRTTFAFSGDPGDYQLLFTNLIDDGAVFYLNNREIIRVRLPQGTIGYRTTATQSVVNAQFEMVAVPSTYLLEGTNSMAVEVHQRYRLGSDGDMVFGTQIEPVPVTPSNLAILSEPQDMSLVEGQTARFEVGLSGGARYQWFKDDLAIPGANGFDLVLADIRMADSGSYWVLASNSLNTVTSRVAVLAVAEARPVVITRQPTHETVSVGMPLSLSIELEGDSPHRFQWYKDGDPVWGGTNRDLVIPSAFLSDTGSYRVSVSNIAGSDQSSNVLLTVLSVPRGGPGTAETNFNGRTDSVVRDVKPLPNGQILIGGFFSLVSAFPQRLAAKLNGDGSLDHGFWPKLQGRSLYVITPLSNGQLLVGGELEAVEGIPRSGIARLNADGSLDASFDPGTAFLNENYRNVRRIVVQPDDRILVAGEFSSFNGVPRNGIARLNPDGSLDTDFDPGTGANDIVRALALQPDGRILIGGFFTRFNGTPQGHIARLLSNGSLDPSFLAGTNGANGNVYFISVSGSHILVSGAFTSLAGRPLGKVARLEMDGTPDPDFQFALGVGGSYVYTVTGQPYGHLVIGGMFQSVNGVMIRSLARLLPNGALDRSFAWTPTFLTSADGFLTSALLQDGDILAGGTFFQLSIGPDGLVKVVGDSGPVLELTSLGDDHYRIAWLTNHAEAFVLQTRSDLSTGSWQPAGLPSVQNGHHQTVTVHATNPSQFYRLAEPDPRIAEKFSPRIQRDHE